MATIKSKKRGLILCDAFQAEPDTDVHVTLAQFQDVLEKRNKEIATLKQTVEKLEFELSNVKARNSKLCAMLAQGES
jgi:septal ring factor EnvC (AmiA/AmiB activator)